MSLVRPIVAGPLTTARYEFPSNYDPKTALENVIREVVSQRQEIDEQKNELVHLEQQVFYQKNDINYLKHEMRKVKEQTQEVADLEQEVGELKQKQNTTVMFSAFLSHWLQISKGDQVVFNQVLTNIGQNYDPKTGVFTCTVPGYYVFDVHVKGDFNKFAIVDIRLNGDRLVSAWADEGFGYTSASAHVSIVLRRGDRVDVTAAFLSSKLYGTTSGDRWNMFSGHLVNTL